MTHSITFRNLILFFSCLVIVCHACKQNDTNVLQRNENNPIVKEMKLKNAAVVSAHHLASEIGTQILKDGGNAIDAAISVQFALAVCYPVAGNIGGGGFLIYRSSDGKYDALDFRETAPILAHKDMFLDSLGNVIQNKSLIGHQACGVPGTVDGMWNAYNRYSKLKDWKKLIEPSIKLASDGFAISDRQASRLNKYKEYFNRNNNASHAFVKYKAWKGGDTLTQKELANTLQLIANNGRDGFYSASVADKIVSEMKRGAGIISHKDLTEYKSKWRDVIYADYKEYRIASMPPPSSGGITLVQLFNAVENYNLKELGFHSKEMIHLIVEAERRVYADRASYLGDSDFYNVPIAQLTDEAYMKYRMEDFDLEKASSSTSIKEGQIKESEQTTHFSIVDSMGNAVSLTTTLNTAYGSKVVVSGAGFFLNNEMDDFSIKPGVPNYYGLVGNEANAIEPQKRMLSSMSPSIVEKAGKLKMVVGSPGGSTIITSVFQTIINVIEYEMSAAEATHSCRFHHQWLPDQIMIEDSCFSTELINSLQVMGHDVNIRIPIGKVETIVKLENGSLDAAADIRGEDSVSGY